MRSSTDLIISPDAEIDLRDIYEYTNETWGSTQADAYADVIDAAFRRLKAFPDLGRVASPTDPTVRELALRHHTILYRREPDAVTILRVINPRRLRR